MDPAHGPGHSQQRPSSSSPQSDGSVGWCCKSSTPICMIFCIIFIIYLYHVAHLLKQVSDSTVTSCISVAMFWNSLFASPSRSRLHLVHQVIEERGWGITTSFLSFLSTCVGLILYVHNYLSISACYSVLDC